MTSIYSYKPDCLSREQTDELERPEVASQMWDDFYQHNGTRFFRDRHYLHREFPQLLNGPVRVLEVGCGVGNTAFPLLEVNPEAYVYACDFARTAVEHVRQHPNFSCGRIEAFELDITQDDLLEKVPKGAIDFVTMVFVLSALDPPAMQRAVANIRAVLKPGGQVLVRDYGKGDWAEQRFTDARRLRKLGDSYYVRGDGTRAFYFSKVGLQGLFDNEGFCCREIAFVDKVVENRLRRLLMDRRWIQAVFTQKSTGEGNSRKANNIRPPDIGPQTQLQNLAGLRGSSQGVQGDAHAACEPICSPSGDLRLNGVLEGQHEDHVAPGCAFTEAGSVRQDPPGSSTGVLLPDRRIDCEYQPEWEDPTDRSCEDVGFGVLFGGAYSDAMEYEEVDLVGMRVRLRMYSGELKHTLAHTGLMRWSVSPLLARLLTASPQLVEGKNVVEVGCGASPLLTLSALTRANRVVATDGSVAALELLSENLSANSRLVVIERARVRQLAWGNSQHLAEAMSLSPGGFDLVIGADVVYVEEAMPALFHTMAALIDGKPKGLVLLGHVPRRVSEEAVCRWAAAAGLVQQPLPPAMQAAVAREQQGPANTTSICIMLFGKQQVDC